MRINAPIMQQDIFLLYNRAEVRFLFYELYKIVLHWNGLCHFAKNNTINLHTLWQKCYKSIFKSRFISISRLHRGKLQSALLTRAHTETFDWDMTPNRYLSPPHTWLFYPPAPHTYYKPAADLGQDNAYLRFSPVPCNCLLKWGPFPVGPLKVRALYTHPSPGHSVATGSG